MDGAPAHHAEGALQGSAAGVSPELVVTSRAGSVLLRNTILKSDHFPGATSALPTDRHQPSERLPRVMQGARYVAAVWPDPAVS